jgi:hypothetical protein
MDRRRFLSLLGAGTAGLALADAIPFGRVWSFPSVIRLPGSILVPPGASVRFLRIYDVYRPAILSRVDVLFGFVPRFWPPDHLVAHYEIQTNESGRALRYRVPTALGAPDAAIGELQRLIDSGSQAGIHGEEFF